MFFLRITKFFKCKVKWFKNFLCPLPCREYYNTYIIMSFFVKALKDGRALASIGNFLELVKLGLNPNYLFSDCRLEWRSLDPTLDISSPFVKKKAFCLLFFLLHHFLLKKTQLFIKMHFFICI